MAARRRLDAEMLRRGLVPSREQAARLINDGKVLVDGAVADKPARQVLPGQDVKLAGPRPRFVSRAGGKLIGALDEFSVDPTGWRCLDAGSSTGGFTDCLLQRGATQVYAVDVGTHQLHERLRSDPRVEVREQTDVRSLTIDMLGGPVDLVVGDLSFISLAKVLPSLVRCAVPGASMLLLIKPQFEAGRQEASRGKGIITDPSIWRRVLHEVAHSGIEAGAAMLDLVQSQVAGTNGNIEFVGRFVVGASSLGPLELSDLIDDVIDTAAAAQGEKR